MRNVQELIDEIKQLSADDRGLVIDTLLDECDASDVDLSDEWIAEMRRRVDDYESGRDKGISGEEARLRHAKRLGL